MPGVTGPVGNAFGENLTRIGLTIEQIGTRDGLSPDFFKPDDECGAMVLGMVFSLARFDVNSAAEHSDKFAHERHPQSGALFARGAWAAVTFGDIEQVSQSFSRHTDTVILDGDADHIVLLKSIDFDEASLVGKFDRVGKDVADHRVGERTDVRFNIDLGHIG